MQVTEKISSAISKGYGFVKRQRREWKVTVVRSSLDMSLYRMVLPYRSVYTMALGATGTQLGMVNSIGMAIAGVVGPFLGWITDRTGIKRVYLIGIIMLAISYLTYGLAQSWPIIILAMLAYWLGMTMSYHGCTVICGNSLASEDRATGMALCETLAMGLLGFIAPMVGASLVNTFGGVNISGIRPLFFISLGGVAVTFLLILTKLPDRKWGTPAAASPNFFKDISQIFKEGKNLKRWLVIASITSLPTFMILPFTHPFAYEIKGAEQYILGWMVTGSAVVPLILGIPIGRLADRIGRKKVVYLLAPLVWASSLVLVFAPSHGYLVLAGVLQGFITVSTVVTGAMTYELVAPEQMGRWMGIVRFFRMTLNAVVVYLAGIVWDNVGPQYLFLAVIALDLLVKIPLLIGMPETLGLRAGAEQSE